MEAAMFLLSCVLTTLAGSALAVQINPFLIQHGNGVTEMSQMSIDNDANVAAYRFPSSGECLVLLNATENPHREGEEKLFDVIDLDPSVSRNQLGDATPTFCFGQNMLVLTTSADDAKMGRISERTYGRGGCGIGYNGGRNYGYRNRNRYYSSYGGPYDFPYTGGFGY